MCIYVCLDVVCQNGGWILKDREIYVFKMRMPTEESRGLNTAQNYGNKNFFPITV